MNARTRIITIAVCLYVAACLPFAAALLHQPEVQRQRQKQREVRLEAGVREVRQIMRHPSGDVNIDNHRLMETLRRVQEDPAPN